MLTQEYHKRTTEALNETKQLLAKALTRYENDIQALKMEIIENKELGNKKEANRTWVDYCNASKNRVAELRNHITKLEGMLNS